MDILIVGNTAREHALAWKFAESRKIGDLYCTSPYSGVDTLCERVHNLKEWRASHSTGLVVGEQDDCLYSTSRSPAHAVRIVVDCMTDGKTIIPMPAVRVYYDEKDGPVAAEAPAREYTRDIAHRAYHRYFLPYIRPVDPAVSRPSGIVRFEMALLEKNLELLSASVGFGEMDALCLLPLLRCELAGALVACMNGGLADEMIRFSEQSCSVLMLGAEQPGIHIRGLADIPKNVGVFLGEVRFTEGKLLTAGRRALFVCARGRDRSTARHVAQTAAGKVKFGGVIRYDAFR